MSDTHHKTGTVLRLPGDPGLLAHPWMSFKPALLPLRDGDVRRRRAGDVTHYASRGRIPQAHLAA